MSTRVTSRGALVHALVDGLSAIYQAEGIRGLYRGTTLALVGVSNGAIQFMGYEKMKAWGFDRKRRQFEKTGREWTHADDKLVCQPCSATALSIS